MRRRSFLSLLVVGAAGVAAAPSARAEAVDRIADRLRAEGYRNVQINRTLLGRIRITAETDAYRREIVVDRGSGEILRDLREERPGAGEGGGSDE